MINEAARLLNFIFCLQCHKLLEEYEEELFDWFKNKQNKIESDLHNSFCIDARKHCCPKETYGSSCTPCQRNLDSVCSGKGKCDVRTRIASCTLISTS